MSRSRNVTQDRLRPSLLQVSSSHHRHHTGPNTFVYVGNDAITAFCEGPSSTTVSPVANDLAVSFEGTGTEGMAVFPINSNGTLGTPTPFLPLTSTNGSSNPWLVVWDSTGSYIFASDYGKIYELKYDPLANTLSLVSTTVISTSPYALPDQITFLNGHLFALSSNPSNLYVYNFSNGVLTLAPGSPVPLGFKDQLALAVLQR